MEEYQVIVHYRFKKGMEEKGIQYLETELLKNARNYGCHTIEFCQNEREPSEVLGMATWNSLEEARKFQSLWSEKERELISLCAKAPAREVFKIRSSYMEKARKSA